MARIPPFQVVEAGSKPVGAIMKKIVREDGSVVILIEVEDNCYLPYLDGKIIDWTELFQRIMERGQAGNAAPC